MKASVWKHVKSLKEYEIICFAVREDNCIPQVVYRRIADVGESSIWVRPAEEFFDGRFEEIRFLQDAALKAGEAGE